MHSLRRHSSSLTAINNNTAARHTTRSALTRSCPYGTALLLGQHAVSTSGSSDSGSSSSIGSSTTTWGEYHSTSSSNSSSSSKYYNTDRRHAVGHKLQPSPYFYSSASTSPLHAPFMGASTRFRTLSHPLSRADIAALEKESLSHSPPGRINDHVCIAMVKVLRWVADRLFRERYIHRATILKSIASAAPSAGCVVAYLSTMCARRKRLDAVPYVQEEAPHSQQGGGINRAPGLTHSGNNYAEELRGLLSQAECHAVHYQILINMAEIHPVERALVLVLQLIHFAVFFVLFTVYPRMGFRLMGYLAEESSVVWTQMINDIDLGKIAEHHVPELALSYWGLHDGFLAQGALVPAVVPHMSTAAALIHDPPNTHPDDKLQSSSSSSSAVSNKMRPAADDAIAKNEPTATESASAVRHSDSAALHDATTTITAGDEHNTEDPISGQDEEEKELSKDTFTLRDAVLLIRSDEMIYRDLNHRTADALDNIRRKEPGSMAKFILEKLQIR